MQASPPPVVPIAAPATQPDLPAGSPCTITTIALDPATPIVASPPQSFIIALRASLDGDYRWMPRPLFSTTAIRYERTMNVSDVSFQNLDRAKGSPPIVGGEATQFFVFDALSAGTAKIVFDLGHGFGKPVDTKTFSVQITARAAPCVSD